MTKYIKALFIGLQFLIAIGLMFGYVALLVWLMMSDAMERGWKFWTGASMLAAVVIAGLIQLGLQEQELENLENQTNNND